MENPYLAEEDDEDESSTAPFNPLRDTNPYLRAAAAQPNPYLEQEQPPQPDKADSTLSPSAGPGYGEIALDAGARGLARGAEKITDFYEGMRRKLSGQTFFHVPQHEEAKASPEVENLLNTPIEQGWSSPKWWTAKAVNALTEGWPEAAAATVGGLVRGMPGAIAGMGIGTGGFALIPAFRDAKARGATDDEAVEEAAKVAAVQGGTAAIAGLAGMQGFSGVTAQVVNGKTVQALKHPIREAFVQLGLIQPGVQAAGQIATEVLKGRKIEDIGPWELAEGVGLSVLTQSPFTGFQIATMRQRPQPRPRIEPLETEPQAIPVREVEGPVPQEGFLAEEQGGRGEQPTFYSQVRRIVEEKGPNAASPEQWAATLRNAPGVRESELANLGIPEWLKDHQGKISKAEMLAHIEENQIQIVDRIQENIPSRLEEVDGQLNLVGGRSGGLYEEYTLHGPRDKYMELSLNIPREKPEKLPPYWKVQDVPGGEYKVLNSRGDMVGMGKTSREAVDNAMAAASRGAESAMGFRPESYYSPHYGGDMGRDQIGTVRATKRFDRDGKTSLVVEEIQSDWAQQGRKYGFRGEPTPPALLEKIQQTRAIVEREIQDPTISTRRRVQLEVALRNLKREERLVGLRQPPDYPFKTSWEELLFKRILRYAADEGYNRIIWTNGEQQIARYPGLNERQMQGMRDFYGEPGRLGVLDKIALKWAKKLGMQGGETQLHIANLRGLGGAARQAAISSSQRMRYIDVSPTTATHIQRGLPLYEQVVPDLKISSTPAPVDEPAGLRAAARQAIKVLERVRKAMNLEHTGLTEIQIVNDPTVRSRGQYSPDHKIIRLNLANAASPEQIFSTLSHEFGHHLMFEVFNKQQLEVRLQIFEDYDKFFQKTNENPLAAEVLPQRRSGISEFNNPSSSWGQQRFQDFTPQQQRYWFGFNEWFADNVARWATTDQKPLSIVDKFFSSLGQRIRDVIREVRRLFGGKEKFEAAPAMRDWLNSFMKEGDFFGPEVATHAHLQGLLKNARALDREGTEAPPYPMTGSTGGGRAIVEGAGAGDAGLAAAAHADRMTWFHKVALSLQQIARENPHILPLQLYRELVDLQNLDVMTALNQADNNVLRPWKHLNEQEGIALGKVIDDYANGRFMDPKELAKDGLRRPSVDELVKLMEKHGLSTEAGRRQFHSIIQDLQKDLMRYKEILLAETARIRDPIEQAQAMERIEAQIRAMDSVPFMPFARFGEYTLTWYDANGKVKEFYRFETARARDAAQKQMQARVPATEKAVGGVLHKDVHPLLGMPPGMLDRIADKLNLSQSMRDSIDQLKFEYAPAQSFRHHFQTKDFTPGYSKDWQRAYAQYKFHGSHYFARIKYADQMREMIREMTEERKTRLGNHDKLDQIRNFMTEHLDTVLNPKADWATFKGIMFHFHMGFRVATAAINLTQVPMVAWPNLASHFGDAKSAAALIRASTRMNTYFRRSTIEHMKGDEIRVMQQAMDDGLVSPKQAFEIAGLSEGRNLFKGLGKGVEAAWQTGTEYSAKMFELSEQWGRRVTLMGAYDLAKKNLTTPFVRDSVNANQLLYLRLREKGWSNEEASAYTAAKVAVDQSMFEYGYHARPKMFQGALGAALVFKSFQQNVLFNMWSNKGSMIRQMLLLGGAAGLAGLPFSEDIMGIMKMLSKHFLSKDFDLEDEVRKQVRDISEGTISPDLILHGVGRYAFGIPHALGMMGRLTGLAGESEYTGPSPQPMGPSISRSIGMGNVLPFEVGRAFTPAKNQAQQELQQIQRASGAGFGLGFALYNFAMSNPFTDPDRKKWEPILPATIRDVSQAWRFSSLPGGEGGERNRQGNQIIRFDPYDTLGMAEVLQRATGFQPTRLVARHENIAAKAEAEAFWDIRRQLLMRQFWSATRDQNSEQRSSVLEAIRNFNRGLPPEARGKAITQTSLQQSLQRRVQERARTEAGFPTNLRSIGLYREIDSLYPEGAPAGLQDVRRVR